MSYFHFLSLELRSTFPHPAFFLPVTEHKVPFLPGSEFIPSQVPHIHDIFPFIMLLLSLEYEIPPIARTFSEVCKSPPSLIQHHSLIIPLTFPSQSSFWKDQSNWFPHSYEHLNLFYQGSTSPIPQKFLCTNICQHLCNTFPPIIQYFVNDLGGGYWLLGNMLK